MNAPQQRGGQADILRAVEILRAEAECLRECHAPRGDWTGEPEAQADHDEWIALADQLEALTSAPPAPSVPTDLLDQFEPGGAEEVLRTYLRLHEGKLGAHWLWCAVQQIAAGHGEAEVMSGFGYAPSVGGWMPIETAPKDGRKFLAWRRHSTLPLIVFYNADYDQYECSEGHLVFSLTHWQPLPQPPKEKP